MFVGQRIGYNQSYVLYPLLCVCKRDSTARICVIFVEEGIEYEQQFVVLNVCTDLLCIGKRDSPNTIYCVSHHV